MRQPNLLIHTTSPYLLQHAYNPINWYAWDTTALKKAQQEDKPILLSIGYAACHWCHVMAKESFEDKEVAAIMNKNFVCIKVDREERPDIDQVYITAMQAMGLQVGWPLHVFLLPNQQPFYGGTYFPIQTWKQLLENITQAFKNNRAQLAASAYQFTKSLQDNPLAGYLAHQPAKVFTKEAMERQFYKIYQQLDLAKGGIQGAPKFPLPSLNAWLLDYYQFTNDVCAGNQLKINLTNLAFGGIYDQLGGGFSRYATDEDWRVPHFEKMLYDNAQLISLYANAYLVTHDDLYQQVIEQTIAFLEREMMDEHGAFYSALDADSQGIEGKFYTWTQKEIEQVVKQDASLLIAYFNVTASGNWENGVNVLYKSLGQTAKNAEPGQAVTQTKIQQAKKALFAHRCTRQRPSLDDKLLTSWNGMMIQALIDAYIALDDPHFLAMALKNAAFVMQNLVQGDQVWHSYRKQQLGVAGYLEDYAWLVKAFISIYQATFEEKWLYQAQVLVSYVMKNYWDEEKQLFYFTEKSASKLINRPQEIFDQVIPSTNAVMAHNLFYLGHLLCNPVYLLTAQNMLSSMSRLLDEVPLHLTHWASLYIKQVQAVPIVAIVGPEYQTWAKVIKQQYPVALLTGTATKSDLPVLADKKVRQGESMVYICYESTCQPPIHSLEEALAQLQGTAQY